MVVRAITEDVDMTKKKIAPPVVLPPPAVAVGYDREALTADQQAALDYEAAYGRAHPDSNPRRGPLNNV